MAFLCGWAWVTCPRRAPSQESTERSKALRSDCSLFWRLRYESHFWHKLGTFQRKFTSPSAPRCRTAGGWFVSTQVIYASLWPHTLLSDGWFKGNHRYLQIRLPCPPGVLSRNQKDSSYLVPTEIMAQLEPVLHPDPSIFSRLAFNLLKQNMFCFIL